MPIDVVDFVPSLTEAWEAFVRRHPLAGFGHLAANFALVGATPGLRNASLLAVDGDTVLGVLPLTASSHRAMRVIPVRELMSGVLFPAGPLISATAQGKGHSNILEALLDGARARAAAMKVDRLTITYPNVAGGQPASARFAYSPLLHYGYRARPGVGLLLDLSQPVDKLAAGMDKECRRIVRKAEEAGTAVAAIRDRAQWMACHDLNVQTLGALAYSEGQLAAIWDNFVAPGLATPYAVSVDGGIASVATTITWNGSAYYWIGWNRRPPVRGASHLALWSAILASRESGCRYFELGSLEFADPKNIGISRFKQSFGGVAHATIGAELELRPMKTAAVTLAQSAVTGARRRLARAPRAQPADD